MFIHGDNVSGFLESKDSHIQFLKIACSESFANEVMSAALLYVGPRL
jgi:hypothetical protein